MRILSSVFESKDVKELGSGKLPMLCSEIREFLIKNLSSTGGHLSSNLGVVELTVALHRVYDTEKDRLVFDVGHQCYVHKILTGRREGFENLRSFGGISGFPKPCESRNDAFIAGHASNSISVALGMARARTLRGENYDVAAVLGDGALTGGLAYEGLSDAGQSSQAIVIVLNDNGMSINKSVGGVVKILSKLRVRPRYLKFKKTYRRIVGKIPPLYKLSHGIKERIKRSVLPGSMFEDMGLYYMGPIDGHDVYKIEATLKRAKELRRPVLVHVLTKKGKGYEPAERDPETYHGVNVFDPETGVCGDASEDFSFTFGEALTGLAEKDADIVAITAAMTDGTGLSGFAARFPERFFDVGIAEGHAAAMAAGLAKQGAKPVFAVYSTFLQRGFDMLLHDIALQNLHVVLAVDRAGIVGRDGETHQGVFDVAFLRSVPGMRIFCPACRAELREMLETAVCEMTGPVAIRYPKGREGLYKKSSGNSAAVIVKEGRDLTILCYGIVINEALKAGEILESSGISAEIVKLNRIKPLDYDFILSSVEKTGRFLAVEDVCSADCVGRNVLTEISARGLRPKASELLNLGNGIVTHGDVSDLFEFYKIDAKGIAAAAEKLSGNGEKT
ncbi:MAG: 1-deoxy-D-xylulose-5-phosphate synthase [Oscillospiraceae bacterium]|nr:1-deoxy-D-xylulose-5-phosphate synthase [Oscillospiraceae bacterium]